VISTDNPEADPSTYKNNEDLYRWDAKKMSRENDKNKLTSEANEYSAKEH
jgi:hypothetical protein